MSLFKHMKRLVQLCKGRKSLAFVLLFSFCSFTPVWAEDPPPDDPVLSEILALEKRITDNPPQVVEESKKLILSLSVEKNSLVWLRAQTLWLEAAFSSGERGFDQKQIDEWLHHARKLQDTTVAVRLIMMKAAILKETGDKEKSLEYYAEAVILCRQASQKALCAHVWRERSYYHYLIGDYPKALECVHKALSLFDKQDPEQVLGYYVTNNTLAIILDSLGDFDKALPIYERVYEYFSRNQHRFYSSVLAYNIAKGILLNKKGVPVEKSLFYFQESASMAEKIHDQLSVAWAQMGIGEYYFKAGQYQRALGPLRSAEEIFSRLSVRPQAGECWLLIARVHLKLKNIKESEKSLASAKDNIPNERQAEISELRRSEYELAKMKGDFAKALEHLESYSKAFEEKAEKDQLNQLNSLRVTMGLEAEELRSESLKREVDLQQRLLTDSEKITYLFQGLFAAAILAALSIMLIFIQQRRDHARRLWMEQVLESIDEGIVTIGRDLRVKGGYSKQVAGILRLQSGDLADARIDDILLQNSVFGNDTKAMFREALQASLDGGELGWELNGHQLPSEIVLRGEPQRIIAASWQPKFSGGELVRLIVVIRDVTEKKLAEKELIQRREIQARTQLLLEEVMGANLGRGLAFMQDMHALVDTLKIKILDSQATASCLRELHTRKGVARTLGFKIMAEAIHGVESSLVHFQTSPDATPEVQNDWQALLNILHDVDELLKFSRNSAHRDDSDHIFSLAAELSQEAERQLREHGCVYRSMDVLDEYQVWTQDLVAVLRNVLVHALANSIDHGFVRPQLKGKSIQPARFSLQARRAADQVHISFADNGVGLDWEALKKVADASGFVPGHGQSLADVVFLHGVSTADSLTSSSGRGVGMAAIQEICEGCGGRVRMSERSEGGVILEMFIPGAARPQSFPKTG